MTVGRWKRWGVVVVVLLTSACSDVVVYEDVPAPSPSADAPRSHLEVRWGDYESKVPEPGSQDTFDFVVEVANVGGQAFEWPDPCPTYHWSWSESATDYGIGYGYLNCSDVPTLQPGELQEFLIEAPAAESTGATTFGWELVDPRSCNFMTASFGGAGEFSEVYDTQTLDCRSLDG